MLSRNRIFIIMIGFIFLLTACGGGSTEEKIYTHLEEAVHLEKDFQDQQDGINELEQEEQEIYDEIIDLTMDDFDKIEELANEAIETIEERESKIEIEKQSMDDSKEEFSNVEALIDKVDSEDVKTKANEMYEIMMERYEQYNQLHEDYLASLKLETSLYEMVQDKETEQEKVIDQITKINEKYEEILNDNEAFNQDTKEYNELKEEFYEIADIDVQYEES